MEKKQFLLLIYGNGEEMMALPEEQRKLEMQKWYDWDGKMTQDGSKVSGEAVHPKGKVVMGTNKKVREGFYPENKKYIIGGFYVINAGSMEEAVEIAKGSPSFDFENGIIEVREIMQMTQ